MERRSKCSFSQLFNVSEGLVKEAKHVTPSHVNRAWDVITSLVQCGCTNLTISTKMFTEALKLEFHSDHTAHKPNPFEIQILNAADHVQTLLYALWAFFFSEYRIPGG